MESAKKIQETVLAIIRHPTENKILLGLREERPIWVPPGGKLDPGETSLQGLVREIDEETGLAVCDIVQIGTLEPYTNSRGVYKTSQFYMCRALTEQVDVKDEELAWEWFAPDALPTNLYIQYKQPILDALENKSGQSYERVMAADTFINDMAASDIYGLDRWLDHPRTRQKIMQGELDFSLSEIVGMTPVLESIYDQNIMDMIGQTQTPRPSQNLMPN